MKSVMYHAVRPKNKEKFFAHYLDFNNFRKQLDFFLKRYGYVTKDEWNEFILNKKFPKKSGKILLTFDDNYSNHFDYVFNELVSRKLWGIFYISTAPLMKDKMLDVHRVQKLTSLIKAKDLLKSINKMISPRMIQKKKSLDFLSNAYIKQKNLPGVTEIKLTLNYLIDYKFRESVIDELFKIYDLESSCEGNYLSAENIKEMHNNEMVIGSQTVNHLLMSKLSTRQQKSEIKNSIETLSSITNSPCKTYCHPFGGNISFNRNTTRILNDFSISYSFSTESREIAKADLKSLHSLPRFDCNEFKFGKSNFDHKF